MVGQGGSSNRPVRIGLVAPDDGRRTLHRRRAECDTGRSTPATLILGYAVRAGGGPCTTSPWRRCRCSSCSPWRSSSSSRQHRHVKRVGALPGTPVGLRPTCGRDARAPRNICGPWAHLRAGRPRSQEHLWALGPLAGGTPALPGTSVGLGPTCGRDARAPRNTCGPSAYLRAGRPRSQEHLWALGPLAGGAPAAVSPPRAIGGGGDPGVAPASRARRRTGAGRR